MKMNPILISPIEIKPIKIDSKIDTDFSTRYIIPPKVMAFEDSFLMYENAEKLAKDLTIEKNFVAYAIVDGSFYFGDFIEALIVKHNWLVKSLFLSTLSFNENNVDSLFNLMDGGYVEKLAIIAGDRFFFDERHNLIRYAYDKLDFENRFQLSTCDNHTKKCLIETDCGLFITIHGSANLRSSSCIEQIEINECKIRYDFNYKMDKKIHDKYFTINFGVENFKKKSIRGKELWKTIQ